MLQRSEALLPHNFGERGVGHIDVDLTRGMRGYASRTAPCRSALGRWLETPVLRLTRLGCDGVAGRWSVADPIKITE